MNKITKILLTIIFIGAVAIAANYARADEDCGGKCRESYTLYIPIVYNPPAKAGYASEQLSAEYEQAIGMKQWHNWSLESPNTHFTPHFSCEVRPYWAFDDDAQNQFTELRRYVAEVGDVPFVLIFLNEPDLWGQCGRTPYHGAMMYAKVLEVAPNAIVTTPQVSHRDYDAGWTWMTEWYYWIDVLGLPHPEIGAIHTYKANEPAHLIIDSFAEEFAIDRIWVTEWGANSTDVLLEMLDTFETDDRVERHFYFDPLGTYSPSFGLIEETGELTPLGDAWVDYFEHDIE